MLLEIDVSEDKKHNDWQWGTATGKRRVLGGVLFALDGFFARGGEPQTGVPRSGPFIAPALQILLPGTTRLWGTDQGGQRG